MTELDRIRAKHPPKPLLAGDEKAIREHVENCVECTGVDRCETYFRLLLEAVRRAGQTQ